MEDAIEGKAWVSLRSFVAKLDALGGFGGNDVPIVAIEALAIDHLVGGAVLHFDVGGVRKTALQTHLWL